MDLTLEDILRFLNDAQMRATYEAVGEVLGIAPDSVPARLGQHRAYSSWVVSASTGSPVGYPPSEVHPALRRNRRIITAGDELSCLMAQREARGNRWLGVIKKQRVGLWRRIAIALGLAKPAPPPPALLMKGEVTERANTTPADEGSSPWVDAQQNAEAWARYEREHRRGLQSADPGPAGPSRRSPTVSGGLPSLNKRRR